MMKTHYYLLLLFWVVGESGCTSSTLGPSAYKQYVEDPNNGLRQEKQKGDLKFILQFKPYDYILLSEEYAAKSKDERNTRINELGQLQYYNFRIRSAKNKPLLNLSSGMDEESLQQMSFLSGGIAQDFYIKEGQDSLPCRIMNFVPNYNLAPFLDFVLGFDQTFGQDKNRTKTFVYNDELFGSGIIEFQIENEKLSKVPKLK